MAFPDTPLGVRVELLLDTVWVDITADVFTQSPIAITRGRPDEGARTDASTCSFVLDNRTGRYSARNPRSDLYGVLGRNTPVRVSIQPDPAGERLVRFVGEVPAWPVRWGTPHDVTVSVQAAGILRRLGQGAAPLHSTMRREFTHPSRTSIVAYWPLEDGSGATEFASAFPSAPPMRITTAGVRPAAYSAYAASDALPTLGTGSLTGVVPRYPSTGEVSLRLFVAIPETPPEAEIPLCTLAGTGLISRWTIALRTDNRLTLYGRMTSGHELVRVIGGGDFLGGRRLSLGLELTEGAVAKYRMYYLDIDAYTLTGGGLMPNWEGSVVGGAVGRITHVTVGGGTSGEVAVGHVTLANRLSAYANTGSAMIGWQSENAHSRIRRLASEEQIPLAYTGNPTATPTRIGAQSVATLLDLIQDAADADEGRFYEPRDRLGLAFRTRATHYTQATTLTLDYTAREVVAPLEPLDDDQAVRNDITVQRSGGSFARAVCESGPLSVQAPPNGIGRYAEQVTTNLATDEQCTPVAWWRLHRGTWDAPRYPAVTVALHEAPHLTGPAAAVDVGHRLAITNPPPWLPPERVELLVEGYTETLGIRTWEITFGCSAGGPWLVATTDHAEYATAGPDDCALAAPLDADATTAEVTATTGPAWPLSSSHPDLYPIAVRIGGEELVVLAVTAGPRAGVQVLTTVRGANGVRLPHPVGTALKLARPALAAL
ncbi:hypothetical protein ABT390_13490 [Streptomyces aurantiacus]|uniref:Uncharacterized protein n=1 Tax=Streptomyces aurantiacus JA 4570 TaxID=1286094 RepID=S3Z9D4_9ACTN|nr:hypothetical protein STRAU_6594 [Streptomyces aurantiacus JA 4570]